MENNNNMSLSNMLKNPGDLLEIARNPGKFGLDTFKSLSNQQKQYVAFAAAAGLLIYGYMVNRH
ncbi:hypothetical protein FVR03_04950 [Pontibacter qinzhouensis]|uniref:Uncharacterized protein n=1 Tax=Pontibacter qinzhouensis TaxID=2603253 RepID=A0A5C8K917_9BACT|nr:hypothetical protein [Pontibacter qinzhouensis]TXK50533.1 hypothetical protein FVR03_04950 [Pontibacter qinzhouensis]